MQQIFLSFVSTFFQEFFLNFCTLPLRSTLRCGPLQINVCKTVHLQTETLQVYMYVTLITSKTNVDFLNK